MATDRLEVYKCQVCGIIAEVLDGGAGELVCCGELMEQLEEKTADAKNEKHVPVVEETGEGLKVKVGSVPHPMEDKHFIELIEVITRDGVSRKFLKPGDAPEAAFPAAGEKVTAREICNIHGLWKGEQE